jgi:hypothetical protein
MAMALYDKTKDRQYLNLVLEIAEQTKARTLADDIQYSNRQIAAGTHDTTMRRVLDLERAIAYNERLAITGNDAEKYRQKISALKYNLSLLNKGYRRPAASDVAHTAEVTCSFTGQFACGGVFLWSTCHLQDRY